MRGTPATLQDLLGDIAARGEEEAVFALTEDGPIRWSYARLADEARGLAAGLLADGLVPGEPVAILAPNRPESVVVRLALIAAGALAVPLDDMIGDKALAHALTDSASRRVFTTRAYLLRLQAIGTFAPILMDDDGPMGWRVLSRTPAASFPVVDPGAPAALFYTSGTTGPPKGVPLSHRNLLSNLTRIRDEGFLGAEDRILLPLPLYHSYPFIIGMLLPLMSGSTIVLPAGVSGPEIVAALRAGAATAMVGVPRLYQALVAGIEARVAARGRLAASLFRALLALSIALRRRTGRRFGRHLFGRLHRALAPHLTLLGCGGARLEAELEWVLEGLGWEVMNGYGLVETTSISTFNPRGRAIVGSVGKPVPGVDVRIDRGDADGLGEVVIRGPNVFAGYHNDPAATAAAFTAEGWFLTGDLGTIDDGGYLTIVGRLKEVIVLADGKNVTPDLVEAHYAESPYVAEIAVLEVAGDLVALAVPDLDAMREAASGRIEDTVRVALAERSASLPSFERISGYAITRERLPRTRLGKYQRHELPAIYARAAAGTVAAGPAAGPLTSEDAALMAEPRARRLWDWLVARYPDRALGLDTAPQLDLGIDSLGWINLGLEIERSLDIRLGEDALGRILTLRDLLQEAVREAPTRAEAHALTAEQRRWIAPRTRAYAVAGYLLHRMIRLLVRGYFTLRIEGAGNLRPAGQCVLVANHLSDLDPLVVAAALDWSQLRDMHWSGEVTRMFHTPLRRFISRAAWVFPIDDRAAATSLAFSRAVLEAGDGMIWFPEGWRSPDGLLQPFMAGIGPLLEGYGGRIVPVAIRGTFEAMPRGRRMPRPGTLHLTFGPARSVDALVATGEGADPASRIADGLRQALIETGAPAA